MICPYRQATIHSKAGTGVEESDLDVTAEVLGFHGECLRNVLRVAALYANRACTSCGKLD
jgi:hypothetical protein